MEKKCIICGKDPELESMSMVSPVCKECAQKVLALLGRDEPIEELIEEYYVPFHGDIVEAREKG